MNFFYFVRFVSFFFLEKVMSTHPDHLREGIIEMRKKVDEDIRAFTKELLSLKSKHIDPNMTEEEEE